MVENLVKYFTMGENSSRFKFDWYWFRNLSHWGSLDCLITLDRLNNIYNIGSSFWFKQVSLNVTEKKHLNLLSNFSYSQRENIYKEQWSVIPLYCLFLWFRALSTIFWTLSRTKMRHISNIRNLKETWLK